MNQESLAIGREENSIRTHANGGALGFGRFTDPYAELLPNSPS